MLMALGFGLSTLVFFDARTNTKEIICYWLAVACAVARAYRCACVARVGIGVRFDLVLQTAQQQSFHNEAEESRAV